MFCTKCGNEVEKESFCSSCGTKADGSSQKQPQKATTPSPQPNSQQAYQGGGYSHVPKKVEHYAPGSFTERLHNYGGSILFLVGIILFSAGSLFSIFMAFNAFSIFSLMILALPVTGFWLIFAASKQPKMPEKVLPSLTLFRVSIIIDLVVKCLLALLLLIAAIGLFAASSSANRYSFNGNGGTGMAVLGFFMLLIAGGVVTFIIIYFKAVLGMLTGIKNGIINNDFTPLPGIGIFTILTYIGAGFTALNALVMSVTSNFMSSSMYSMLYSMPSGVREVFEPFVRSAGNSAFTSFFTLVTQAGIIVCIVALNQFNNSLVNNNSDQ